MITEKDLQEAIAECEGIRNPNANTCIKLAAFYTIREHMFENSDPDIPRYSFSSEKEPETTVNYDGESEFSQSIVGRNAYSIWEVMDELMSTLQVVNPRLYAGVMRKIAE